MFCNDRFSQLSDSLAVPATIAAFFLSDIAVTPLASVLEVNDGRQLLAVSQPTQIRQPLLIQSQNKR